MTRLHGLVEAENIMFNHMQRCYDKVVKFQYKSLKCTKFYEGLNALFITLFISYLHPPPKQFLKMFCFAISISFLCNLWYEMWWK